MIGQMLGNARLSWALWRNRLIASPAIRGLADWFVPARLPARRYARRLFDLTAGFVYAQTTLALVQSGLLDALSRRVLSSEEAAQLAGLSIARVEVLLNAGVSLDLVERHGPVWTLGPLGAALVASPGLPEMIRHHQLFYADLADPLALLRDDAPGRLARLWRYDGTADPSDVAAYSALMAASQPMVAAQAVAAYPFRRHRALLDVGGGVGAFLARVGDAAPGLKLGLFDRPEVVVQAPSHLQTHGGDFQTDRLPEGYDLISLVRVLHDHDDTPARALLASVRQALPTNGRILIVEPLADTHGARPMGHAYFGLYLNAMRSGRPRSWVEYRTMLDAAGFDRISRHRSPLPLVASVISARKSRV